MSRPVIALQHIAQLWAPRTRKAQPARLMYPVLRFWRDMNGGKNFARPLETAPLAATSPASGPGPSDDRLLVVVMSDRIGSILVSARTIETPPGNALLRPNKRSDNVDSARSHKRPFALQSAKNGHPPAANRHRERAQCGTRSLGSARVPLAVEEQPLAAAPCCERTAERLTNA